MSRRTRSSKAASASQKGVPEALGQTLEAIRKQAVLGNGARGRKRLAAALGGMLRRLFPQRVSDREELALLAVRVAPCVDRIERLRPVADFDHLRFGIVVRRRVTECLAGAAVAP